MLIKAQRIVIAVVMVISLLAAGAVLSPVLAVDFNGCEVYDTDGNCLDEFFIKNDIDYDPSIPVCTADGSPLGESNEKPVVEIGAERDYIGRPVVTSSQISVIKKNQSVYETAAKSAGIPWQLLAAIHVKASNLSLVNPDNGLGVYQLSGGSYPVGAIDQQGFLEQSTAVASRLKLSTPELAETISRVEPVKSALYQYFVGSNSSYDQQAKTLGFTTTYDGSPEIMNKVDEKRDSSKNTTTWGVYDKVSGTITYPAGDGYGAWPIVASIAGISLANCAGLVEGGMNLDQAKAFMDLYLKIDQGDPNGDRKYLAGFEVCNSKTDNCVTFSGYFVNKYTTLRPGNVNGGDVVDRMKSLNPELSVGREPRPYAVFSTKKGTTQCGSGACGHTGVVLGVDKAADTIIIGEAAWCRPGFTGAHVYQLSRWTGTDYVYAYTDGAIKDTASLGAAR